MEIEAPKIQTKGYFEQLLDTLRPQIDKEYFEALGRFIHEFSNVEEMLYICLCALLKMELPRAAAVFSGVRAAEAIANIKRIYEADGIPLPGRLAEIFEHVSTLTTARNEIVHYGGRGTGLPERTVSTELKSHTPKKTKQWMVSAATLHQMYLDADKAVTALIVLLSPDSILNDSDALKRAWLYKYPSNPRDQSKNPEKKGRGKKPPQPDQP